MSSFHKDGSQPGGIDWKEVYLENLPRIYNYLRFRIGDYLIAEDLTSSTFEKAWKSRNQYRREISAFSTWLFAIASNLAIDYFRKQRMGVDLSQLDAQGSAQSAEEVSEQNAQYAHLLLLLEKLSSRERELFALKHGADLTNRQIATLTGLSESNVGTILYRIAKQIRAKLDGDE
jgi:RNA polymerase sigma-70 factor (ECF subfamily)